MKRKKDFFFYHSVDKNMGMVLPQQVPGLDIERRETPKHFSD
jgi:hypothetical protein